MNLAQRRKGAKRSAAAIHRRRRPGMLALGLLFALAPSARAPADVPPIPPGNEAVVAKMLGAGKTLPGGCRLASGSIERTFVSAHYDCDGGSAVVELRHPSEGTQAAARTQRFAIVARGTAPAALVDAIARGVTAAEESFEWASPPTAPPSSPPARTSSVERVDGGLAVVIVIAVLAAPLAIVGGLLCSYLAQLFGLARGRESEAADERRLFCYLALFLVIVGLGWMQVVPQWGMQLDEERDFILSALCADGRGCPLVGNEMNQLRIKLGPLNRYLMTLCQLVTPDPRFTLWAILVMHALAAAWLAAAGDSLLGFPFGLVAGSVFGTNPVLLDTIAAASNGAWGSFFLVGTVAGTLRWLGGDRRALVLAMTCLAAAVQLHGTNLVLVPPFLLAAAWWRPPVSGRVLALSALIAVALYSPWLLYQWESGGIDFTLVSTSWMVSEGQRLPDRLGRLVPIFGGVLATLLAVAGAVELARGRVAGVSQRAGGHAVLLLLALPVGGALLAGGNWVARYGIPAIVPGALAVAAGMRALASVPVGARTGWRSARFAAAALASVWVASVVLEAALARARPGGLGAAQVRLDLAEQIEAVRRLGEHGFGVGDLESRVHGVAWDRWYGGQGYLGAWLIGDEAGAGEGEHAVIVECDRIRRGFASWDDALVASSQRMPHLLVGYRTQLAPAAVEFSTADGVVWSKDNALPFYGQMLHGGDAQLRALFDPRLAYPPEFSALQIAWASNPPSTMRMATTLAPGRDDRSFALVYDAGPSATVAVGGVRRSSTESTLVDGENRRERFVVHASERENPLPIEIVIDLPERATEPRRVDLYEEPRCAADSNDGT